ncbi:MAG: hypothetical protein IJZ45_04970 [Bacteroidaceae bacterium]|nr:hypothetical protein [Bacteroidaceae bacterium]
MKHVKMILFFVLTCLALSSCATLVGGVAGNTYLKAREQQRGTYASDTIGATKDLGNVEGNSASTNSVPTNTTPQKTVFKGSDIGVSYNSDSEVVGLSFGNDLGESGYMKYGFNVGFGDIDLYSGTLGIGLKKRYVMNDVFLIQGMIYPYIGYGSTSYKILDSYSNYGTPIYETKTNNDFLYGAAANLSIGLKLWNTKKGNSTFLTLGYYISAPEFKTENMFDNGSWGIGFTTILH